MEKLFAILSAALFAVTASAQSRFVYLTTDDVQLDSILPHVGYSVELPQDYGDSLYTVTLLYPEFIDMSPTDIRNYYALTSDTLPAIPVPEWSVVFDRKSPILRIGVQPLAQRDGKHQWLVSFMLKIESVPKAASQGRRKAALRSTSDIYADHSVLAEGTWAKIRVSETGICELTQSTIRSAGFTDLDKVRIYGYGGNLQPESITADYLAETDDLQEVAQCVVDGRHLFYGRGPVSWESASTSTRTRNPYSDYGYYFITEGDGDVLTVDSAEFVSAFYHSNDDYHSLYEVDGYAWMEGGRNLVDATGVSVGSSQTYTLANDTGSTSGKVHVRVTAGSATTVTIAVNDSVVGTSSMSLGTYDFGAVATRSVTLDNLSGETTVTLTPTSGGPVRLDYISIAYNEPREDYTLSASHPAAEYVCNVTNQDRHADAQADMVIIIPASQKLKSEAERLKTFHEEEGLRVNLVSADELFNEFSSGTPDANAYRRYLKMLYDRAESEADMPKSLLLFGDCLWDNRMLTSATKSFSPDDYLLCFESENSYNDINCYVDDGFFCLLDEGEGSNPQSADLLDVAVGRFPVTTAADAKVMVDKTIAYVENKNAGAWQNTIMFMGDDGNSNVHMEDVNDAAEEVATNHPGYLLKKVMWDSYERQTSSSGNTYPEITKIVKAQQEAGALIMDYVGHGAATQISHERVLSLNDFATFTNENLPLWITASCDIMPFDGTGSNIGETSVLNANGGSFAFFGTTHTVYTNYNKRINMAFLRYALELDDEGNPNTIGEAQRLAKNYLITSGQDKTINKLQYSLLGDPAVALNIPRLQIVVDSINGTALSDATTLPYMKAGGTASIAGHVVTDEAFSGTVTATVRDTKETITCRLNNTSSDGATTAFVYEDRTKTLYNGSDNISDGRFSISFAVPIDINYADDTGLVNLFAVTDDCTLTAHGSSEDFLVGGTASLNTDSIGPSIYCYLNSPAFMDGGNVNPTPYFVAEITDDDGLNVSGTGLGHDLTLIVDGSSAMTYNLNDNFSYDFGSYTSGSTYYSIPTLEEGTHTLQFRAWDIYNNSSTATLRFNVVSALKPTLSSVSCTANPASTTTTFIISHDRMGSEMDVIIDVFDTSGRLLWRHSETGVSNTGNYTVTWDLTTDAGQPLQTGVYLYRARISSDGSSYASKAKKLIIVR